MVWISFFFQDYTFYQDKRTQSALLFTYNFGETDGFMHFPRELEGSETHTPSFRIWTLVADSISYDDNFYTKRASKFVENVGDNCTYYYLRT